MVGNYRGITYAMLISLIVDEWNVFLIPQTNLFVSSYFHLNSLSFGFVTGIVFAGAAIGSLIGGYFTDKFGRKLIFQVDMLVFIVAALVSVFSPNFMWFIGSRLVAGIAVGADIANVYAYIMETSKIGDREYTGSLNTLMASISILSINFVVLYMLTRGGPTSYIWKYPLIISAIPAAVGLSYSFKLKETTLWKKISSNTVDKKKISDLFINSLKRKTTLFTWVSGAASTIEIGTFAFFIPFIIGKLGISSPEIQRMIIILVYSFGIPAGYLGPVLLPRLGLRGLSYSGYIITIVSLVLSGLFLIEGEYLLVPFSMFMFVWGNHWNSQPILTSQALVSDTEFRGRSVGITNFISELPAFLSITFFPSLVDSFKLGPSTLLITLAPLAGLITAIFVFKEVYGYKEDLAILGTATVEFA